MKAKRCGNGWNVNGAPSDSLSDGKKWNYETISGVFYKLKVSGDFAYRQVKRKNYKSRNSAILAWYYTRIT